MTRFKKPSGTTGRIVFVGAGPGDPGMLTARASAALAEAGAVLVDPDVSVAVQDAVRDAHPGTELSPVEGEPADVAKAAVAAAKNGAVVVRLVAGDPYTAEHVVKEVLAVGRTSVPFDVVPGVATATAVPAYAGVALGSTAVTADLRSGVDLAALAGAASAGGTLVLQGTAEELPDAAARLVEGGLSGSTPVVVTTGGSGTAQKSVVAKLAAVAEKTAGLDAFTGPVVATVGTAVDKRARLSWWESRPLFGWRVLVPRTKDQAGEMSDRLRAYGAVPVEVPTIAVEPPRSPAQMDRAIKGLVTGRYGWIVFTSVNAVKAVREKFAELGLDARAFAGVKVACVGEQTADAIRAFGIVPELVPSGSSPARACWPTSRRTTTSSTRSTGCCCRAPTSPPRRSPPGSRSAAGRSTTSPPTAPSAPPRRPRRSARRSRAAGSTRCASPRRARCATWSASRASRTRRPSSPSSARPPRPAPRSSACGSTSSRRRPPSGRWSTRWPSSPRPVGPRRKARASS